MVYINKDLTDTPTGMGFDPIPAGKYQAHMIDSELSHSKNKDKMLILTWQILEGDYRESLIFDRLMLEGSPKAVAFGDRKIKTMAAAIGHPNPNRVEDTEELHGQVCLITVALGKGDFADRNEIKDFKPLELAAPQKKVATLTPPKASASAPPKSAATPPPPKKQQTPFDPPSDDDMPF